MITDGGDLLARTGKEPVRAGKTLEFLIYSTSNEIKYTWSVYDKMKQLGKQETM
jgi:hypothetical protein